MILFVILATNNSLTDKCVTGKCIFIIINADGYGVAVFNNLDVAKA